MLWYARDAAVTKYRQIYRSRLVGEPGSEQYTRVELAGGERRRGSAEDRNSEASGSVRHYRIDNLTSGAFRENTTIPYTFNGTTFHPGQDKCWKTTKEGLDRLTQAERLAVVGRTLGYVRFVDDFPAQPLKGLWTDTGTGGFGEDKVYVVQTNTKVIERCLFMTTDPGDLVLDPTCGSGTSAYVAEQWGRRWITIDVSRVAVSLARQRLLTSTFPFYTVADDDPRQDEAANPARGLVYKTVPRVTLGSIAQNPTLDPIFARHRPVLDERLRALNTELAAIGSEVRAGLAAKLLAKEKRDGKRAVTEEDRRRWLLPADAWAAWQVPYGADDAWPEPLRLAHAAYRAAWRAKMDEVSATIAAGAESIGLVDQPLIEKDVVRVSGPFTVEGVKPAEQSLDAETPIVGAPEALETFGVDGGGATDQPVNAEAYLDRMIRLLRADGVRFPNNRTVQFARLDKLERGEFLHAEGEWESEAGGAVRAAVSFGPEHGPVTAYQVTNAIRMAYRRGFDDLVFAGFSFDAAAQAAVQEDEDDPSSTLRCHLAHIRPDVQMSNLLKETPSSQLFTVFGSPRTELRRLHDGQYEIEMQGVDIYNPVENTVLPTSADKVAAWFLDADYDGQTFCITQAFFPDRGAWGRLARALRASSTTRRSRRWRARPRSHSPPASTAARRSR